MNTSSSNPANHLALSLSAKQVEFKNKILDDPQVVEALIGGSAGGPLPVRTKVATPTGMKAIGSLKIGDDILDVHGGVAKVIDIPYEGNDVCRWLYFQDGVRIPCSINHLWKVATREETEQGSFRILTVEEIKKELKQHPLYVPLPEPAYLTPKTDELPLHPYLLGMLFMQLDEALYDVATGKTRWRFYCHDAVVLAKCLEILGSELQPYGDDRYEFWLDERRTKKLLKNVIAFDRYEKYEGRFSKIRMGKNAKIYVQSSVQDRADFIKGLLDNGGLIRRHPSKLYILLDDKKLRATTLEIARSLGLLVIETEKGLLDEDCPALQVRASDYGLILSNRKKFKSLFYSYKHKWTKDWKRITKVGSPGKDVYPVRCISTSAPDGLFITKGYTVTHNSKTMSMCIAMLLAIAAHPGIQFALGRKTLQGLTRSTVATLLGKAHPLVGITPSDFHYDKKLGVIEYKNGSKITLMALDYEPSDPDFARLGSAEFDWAFIDEAGEIGRQAKDVLRSRLGRGEATQRYGIPPKLILSCNPANNFLRPEYYQPYKNMGAGGFQRWQIGEVVVGGKRVPAYRAFLRMSVKDNPFIDANYIETLKQLPERERKRLLDGNWDYNDNDRMLFTGELIDTCTLQELPEMSMTEKCDYLMGVDVADVGTDSTVISIVQNNILVRQISINLRDAGIGKDSKIDVGDFLAEKIIYQAKLLGFTDKDAKRITIETNGIGASLRDALRRKKWLVTEYSADVKTRGLMYYALHELMVDGKVAIYNNSEIQYDELRRQLSAHEYEMEGDKVRLTNKKNLRRLLGCSPDLADSFAIAMFPRGDAMPILNPPAINYYTKVKLY